jgi:hypothetical protein
MQKDIDVSERLNQLVERRGYRMSDFDIKYRGKLKTTKYMVYEASQKKHLFNGLLNGLKEL